MKFSKAEGLGNDFVIVREGSLEDADWPLLAREMCERHTGIGADGLLVYHALSKSKPGSFRMRIFNADGSEAELSGNGLRCLAAHLCALEEGKLDEILIQTQAGSHLLRLTALAHPSYWFLVEMGQPILERSRIDFTGCNDSQNLVGCSIPLDDKTIQATISSMGNPHCTIFVNAFDQMDWEEIGKQLETHEFFPRRTNVEFVRVIDPRNIEVRFWERGVGKTLSSGTGTSAAVVASILNGFTEKEVVVHTLGGILEIDWLEDKQIHLRGPAKLICEGEYYVG